MVIVTEKCDKTVEAYAALCYNIAKDKGKKREIPARLREKKDAESSTAEKNVKRENFIC